MGFAVVYITCSMFDAYGKARKQKHYCWWNAFTTAQSPVFSGQHDHAIRTVHVPPKLVTGA